MVRSRPVCDRHTNLQMIPCTFQTPTGKASGYVCAVPGCGRHHVDAGYFDGPVKSAQEQSKPNRQAAALAAILRAIGEPAEADREPPR